MRPSLIVKLLGTVAAMGLLAVLVFAWQGQGQPAAAQSTIDQISIDMSPDDVHPRVTPFVNGDPAVGDRDANGHPDAEGAADQINGIVGTCGNGIDDDGWDADADTVVDTFDGVADDGCVQTLGPGGTGIGIRDDGALNQDEETADRAFIDITVGSPAAGGVPAALT